MGRDPDALAFGREADAVLDFLTDFILGPVVDLLPFDISTARRERRYRRGERVYLSARVTGVAGVPRLAGYLAAQSGQLWVSTRRRDGGEILPLPEPTGEVKIIRARPTMNKNPGLAYPANGVRVEITCSMRDWELLQEVVADASA